MLQFFRYSCIALFLFFIFCQRHDPYRALQENIDREISDRLSILSALSKYDDSLKIKTAFIHNKVSDLILLSKDVENPSALVNEANDFFSEYYDLSETSGMRTLRPFLSGKEMEVELKENELWILNQMIFNNHGADLRLFSVADEVQSN